MGWAFVLLQFLPLVLVSICFIFETVDARSMLLFYLFLTPFLLNELMVALPISPAAKTCRISIVRGSSFI